MTVRSGAAAAAAAIRLNEARAGAKKFAGVRCNQQNVRAHFEATSENKCDARESGGETRRGIAQKIFSRSSADKQRRSIVDDRDYQAFFVIERRRSHCLDAFCRVESSAKQCTPFFLLSFYYLWLQTCGARQRLKTSGPIFDAKVANVVGVFEVFEHQNV